MFVPFNVYRSLAGITPEAQPVDATNTPIGSPLTAGFTEFGLGAYGWTVQTLPGGTMSIRIQNHSDHSFTGTVLGPEDYINVPQTGDTFAVGATAAGLTSAVAPLATSAGLTAATTAINAHTDSAIATLDATPVRTGTAQAGGISTITLDSGANANNTAYVGQTIQLTGGTGLTGEVRTIIGYVGSTKVATVDSPWTTNPASNTTFAILPQRPAIQRSVTVNP